MALPNAIATIIQNRLDNWWSQHHTRPKLALVRSRMAAAAAGTAVQRVRCWIVQDPGDGLGPSLMVEIDHNTLGTVSQAFRPTVAAGDQGRTINDVDGDGPTPSEIIANGGTP